MAQSADQQALARNFDNFRRKRIAQDLENITGQAMPEPITRTKYREAKSVLAQMKDAAAAQEAALRSGNLQAYQEARQKELDDRMKYITQLQMNANDNNQRMAAAYLKRMTDVEKELTSKLSTEVLNASAKLKQSNAITERSTPDSMEVQNAIFAGMAKVKPEDRMLYLKEAARQFTPQISETELIEQIRQKQPQGRFLREIQEGIDAESRTNNDANKLRNLHNQYANVTKKKGFAGGSYINGITPESLEKAYLESTPEGSRDPSFLLEEKTEQLQKYEGGTSDIMEEAFENPFFIESMKKHGFNPYSAADKRRFYHLARRGKIIGAPDPTTIEGLQPEDEGAIAARKQFKDLTEDDIGEMAQFLMEESNGSPSQDDLMEFRRIIVLSGVDKDSDGYKDSMDHIESMMRTAEKKLEPSPAERRREAARANALFPEPKEQTGMVEEEEVDFDLSKSGVAAPGGIETNLSAKQKRQDEKLERKLLRSARGGKPKKKKEGSKRPTSTPTREEFQESLGFGER